MAAVAATASLALLATVLTVPAEAAPTPVVDVALARSPELSETDRLPDRRIVVTGDRAWMLGTADGRFPAAGFHTRGEMGGFWLPQLKLLDGLWFGVDGEWIGEATRTTTGWGYVRTDLPVTNGVSASRTDFVPDGLGGVLVGLSLRSDTTRTVRLHADAHSELLGSYPWGETTPSQLTENLPDLASEDGGYLLFRDHGKPPHPNSENHDWAAAVGTTLDPVRTQTGPDFRGPQDPAVICPASGPNAPPQPEFCDDTDYGDGAGGQLAYDIRLRAGQVRTIWFGVAGSTSGPADARQELRRTLRNPERALRIKVAERKRLDSLTKVSLPGNPLIEASVDWSKQMLAASVQQVAGRSASVGRCRPAVPATGRDAGSHALARRRLARLSPGCSAPMGSTRHSPRSRPGSSGRSRTISGRCVTCRRSSTATAARSCTR